MMFSTAVKGLQRIIFRVLFKPLRKINVRKSIVNISFIGGSVLKKIFYGEILESGMVADSKTLAVDWVNDTKFFECDSVLFGRSNVCDVSIVDADYYLYA